MKEHRILVCGGRDYEDRETFFYELFCIIDPKAKTTIISGGAKGADSLAKEFAEVYNLNFLEFKADWKSQGKRAGPIRNKQMLDEGKPDFVVAFPGGDGTADMVRRAKRAGVPVVEIPLD